MLSKSVDSSNNYWVTLLCQKVQKCRNMRQRKGNGAQRGEMIGQSSKRQDKGGGGPGRATPAAACSGDYPPELGWPPRGRRGFLPPEMLFWRQGSSLPLTSPVGPHGHGVHKRTTAFI